MLKPTVFREYDIRGVADAELLSADVEMLGQAIGTMLRRRGGSIAHVGADCRLSSPRLREAILTGVQRAGCDVVDLGTVPTPVTYHSVLKANADGGVMITGSHNPADYNGFKVMAGASTIHGDEIQALRRMIESGDLDTGAGKRIETDAVTPYVDDLAARFRYDRRVKVVFDAGNGTAGPVMHRLLQKLNIEPVEMFFEMDGHFPNHHPDPTMPRFLAHLIAEVRASGAEFGVAFDGDSDRIGAVDEQGNVVYGDMLMLIFAREILSRNPGSTFISEVKCSQILYDRLKELGGNPIMWKTGHSLIKAKMKEEGAALAGEMSGHMFFADRYYGYDDAIYAALRLAEIVSASGAPLSAQLVDVPPTFTTPELRLDSSDDEKFAVVDAAARLLKSRGAKVIDIDGARVLFERGWGLVRASNTQPVLVMRFEADSAEALREYQEYIEATLAEATLLVSGRDQGPQG